MKTFNRQLKKLKKDRKGEIYIELIVKTLVSIMLVLFFMEIFTVIIQYQNVTYISKAITKTIEQEGAVTDTAYERLAALNKDLNTNVQIQISDVRYFNNREKTIQFRDSFILTAMDSCQIKLLDPIMGPPIVYNLEMKSTITGMSEVYWK